MFLLIVRQSNDVSVIRGEPRGCFATQSGVQVGIRYDMS